MRVLAERRQPRQARPAGQPQTKAPARRRLYDRHERALAARISRERPGWVVLWGVYSRRFWAFPTGKAIPRGTILSAPHPRELLAAMYQAELAAAPGPPSRIPPPPRNTSG